MDSTHSVTHCAADPNQERRVRWAQRTLYDVRPKPGHDGGTPKTVSERRAVMPKSAHVMWPSKAERADVMDGTEHGTLNHWLCPHGAEYGQCEAGCEESPIARYTRQATQAVADNRKRNQRLSKLQRKLKETA